MRNRIVVFTIVAFGLLAAAASTQAWSSLVRTNHLTFNAAVALPGAVLTPGTYAFQAGPQNTDPHIVRVMTRDGQRTLYMGFSIPILREHADRGTRVSLGEAPAGMPKPILAWYPSGSTIGYQFRY